MDPSSSLQKYIFFFVLLNIVVDTVIRESILCRTTGVGLCRLSAYEKYAQIFTLLHRSWILSIFCFDASLIFLQKLTKEEKKTRKLSSDSYVVKYSASTTFTNISKPSDLIIRIRSSYVGSMLPSLLTSL